MHTRPTALLGGAAILLGFLAGMFVGWRADSFDAVFAASTVPLGVVLGALVIFAVGQVDDLREVSPPAKIAGTVLAGSVLSICRREHPLLPHPVRRARVAVARPVARCSPCCGWSA